MTTWRNRIACWILNSTNTYSEYEVLIAFPLQLWLYERVSMLHNRYFACLVCTLCFPDGAGIMPVCVLRVGPIWSEESPNLYSKGAFGKYLIALWYSYAVAWHYFTNTRTPSLTFVAIRTDIPYHSKFAFTYRLAFSDVPHPVLLRVQLA